jgi:hemerythrin-like domain-containing protein
MDRGRPHGLLAAMQRTLEMMRNRQRAMSSTLLAVRTIAHRSLRTGTPPNFDQLRRLGAYVERFPQKLHQPAEEQHLFRTLERRAAAASRAIGQAFADTKDPLDSSRSHSECEAALVRLPL